MQWLIWEWGGSIHPSHLHGCCKHTTWKWRAPFSSIHPSLSHHFSDSSITYFWSKEVSDMGCATFKSVPLNKWGPWLCRLALQHYLIVPPSVRNKKNVKKETKKVRWKVNKVCRFRWRSGVSLCQDLFNIHSLLFYDNEQNVEFDFSVKLWKRAVRGRERTRKYE